MPWASTLIISYPHILPLSQDVNCFSGFPARGITDMSALEESISVPSLQSQVNIYSQKFIPEVLVCSIDELKSNFQPRRGV